MPVSYCAAAWVSVFSAGCLMGCVWQHRQAFGAVGRAVLVSMSALAAQQPDEPEERKRQPEELQPHVQSWCLEKLQRHDLLEEQEPEQQPRELQPCLQPPCLQKRKTHELLVSMSELAVLQPCMQPETAEEHKRQAWPDEPQEQEQQPKKAQPCMQPGCRGKWQMWAPCRLRVNMTEPAALQPGMKPEAPAEHKGQVQPEKPEEQEQQPE